MESNYFISHRLVTILIFRGVLQLVQTQHLLFRKELVYNTLRLGIIDEDNIVSEEEDARVDDCNILIEVNHFMGFK